jgi:hypothetical protein
MKLQLKTSGARALGSLLVLVACSATFAQLTPGFIKQFGPGAKIDQGKVAIDKTGNSYFFRVVAASGAAGESFQLFKITPNGTTTQSVPLTAPNNNPDSTSYDVQVGQDGNPYVYFNYSNGVLLAKFDTSLNVVWTHSFTSGRKAIQLLATTDGRVHVALNVGTNASGPSSLELVVLSSSNAVLSDVQNSDVSQAQGDYDVLDGELQFFAAGQTADGLSATWKHISESTGVSKGGQTTPFIFSTIDVQPVFAVQSRRQFPSGSTIVAQSMVTSLDINANLGATQLPFNFSASFSLSSFLNGDSRQEVSVGTFPGSVLNLGLSEIVRNRGGMAVVTRPGLETAPTNVVYMLSNALIVSPQAGPPPSEAVSAPALKIVASSLHFFVIKRDTAHNQTTIEEHGSSIFDTPSATYTFSGDIVTSATATDEMLTVSAPIQPNSNVQASRVIGFPLAADVLGIQSPSSVKGGNSVSVTVQLTRPAPAGGIAVKMHSSPNLLFANNTQDTTLAIPAGSVAASLIVHSKPVTSVQNAEVAATLNGANQAADLNITP